jgi:hypothetical protein
LVIESSKPLAMSLSVDRGKSWTQAATALTGETHRGDLTDAAEGHRQYWLRIESGAEELKGSDLKITTVCQANSSIIPRLTDKGSVVRFQSSGLALESAGPNMDQATQPIVGGKFDSPRVTLQLAAPRISALAQVYAATHVASSNPPSPDFTYRIEYSIDGGKRNMRSEVHVAYRLPNEDATRVTFHWKDDAELHTQSQTFEPVVKGASPEWNLATGTSVETLWVEYTPVP